MATPLPDSLKSHRSEGRQLAGALLALLVLAGASWGLSHLALGKAEAPVAIGIAAVKACIVALWFMELSKSSVVTKFIALVVLLFIALLCTVVYLDVSLR